MMKKSSPSNDIGIDDPANKWLVRWLVLWGISIVLSILASGFILGIVGLSYLAYVIGLLGTVCAVIWLLKILEVI